MSKKPTILLLLLAAASLLFLCLLFPGQSAAQTEGGVLARVSVGPGGVQANARSRFAGLSADGRYVAFHSQASNLVANDSNGFQDTFVHDRQTGLTQLISVASNGSQGNADSGFAEAPALSADGRHIAFVSAASNLVSNDTNNLRDVFVHDRQSGTTVRVSVRSDGGEADNVSQYPAISADGRYVAFLTNARLVPGDTDSLTSLYVHDRDSDDDGIFDEPGAVSIVMVSVANNGTPANSPISFDHNSLSADGRYVTFATSATNLVLNDTNGQLDIFVHDRDLDNDGVFDEPGAIGNVRVSVAENGTQGNGGSFSPDISADGRFVAFASIATNLVPNDLPVCGGGNCRDVFLHDRDSDGDGIFDEPGATSLRMISVASDGSQANGNSSEPALNQDGTLVAFSSTATNLVGGLNFGAIYVHEPASGITRRVSEPDDGSDPQGRADRPAISGSGQAIAFDSSAHNLVPGDTNGVEDVFVANSQGTAPTPTPSPTATHTPAATPSPTATPPVQPPGEGWQQQTLDVRGWSGMETSLAHDSQGRPHISFRSEPISGRSVLKYTYWDGVLWHTTVVDSEESTGFDNDIAIDSSGDPQISYRTQNGALRRATWDGSSWILETVASGPGVGHGSVIALQPSNGQVHILHRNALTGELLHTQRGTHNWTTAIVANNLVPNTDITLEFDKSNVLHATYYANNNLHYLTWNGSSWTDEVVFGDVITGNGFSLAFDNANRPYIAYANFGNDYLQYEWFDGLDWQRRFMLRHPGGDQPRIAISSNDEVFVSYYDNGSLYLAVPDGTSFQLELLDRGRAVGARHSLGLDNADQPHVAYHDSDFGDLKYVTWGPHWELRSVHPGTNSQEPDLALNQTSPGISFHNLDDLPDELLYAAWDGTDWAAQTLQTSSNSTAHTALRYDAAGRPHVAAITALDRTLTYRYWDGTAWQTELVEEISTGDFGHEIQLLLDDADFPIIIYTHNDGAQRRLRLAWWDGNDWQFSTNSQSPTLGSTYELAAGRLAGSSLVYVSYYEMTGGDLRLATWDGTGWSDELVDDGGGADTGRFPAIAIDARLIDRVYTEIVAIAYFDATNQRIRYSYRDTGWHRHTPVANSGLISSLDLVLGNDSWLSPHIAYTASSDNSLRLVYSVDGLLTYPIDIVVASAGAALTQVSLDYDYAPRLAFRDASGQIQYAFPSSRHLAAAPPPDVDVPLAVFELDPVLCLALLEMIIGPDPGPDLLQPRDESTMGGLTFLFARTDAGRGYLELYADHVDEMAQITWSDPELAWDAYLTLQNLRPGLEALVNDSGHEVMVTQAMVDQALDIWQRIAAQAGPELAGVINSQLAATNNLQDFVDGSFDDWALGIGVMPPGGNVYLPLITVPGTTTPPADSQSVAPTPFAALPPAPEWRRRIGSV